MVPWAMLNPGMLPEQIELVLQQGFFLREACHRGLHDANEHALFEWWAGVGRRRGVLGRLAPSNQAKFSRKLARSAQDMIVLHNSGKQQVNVNHKLSVGTLLSSMEIA